MPPYDCWFIFIHYHSSSILHVYRNIFAYKHSARKTDSKWKIEKSIHKNRYENKAIKIANGGIGDMNEAYNNVPRDNTFVKTPKLKLIIFEGIVANST